MAHRLTKEELDEQFELFLKESVSDESVDVGGSDKQPRANSRHRAPWRQEDTPSGSETRRAKSRFIKARKAEPENNDAVSAEPFSKPVPKPRSKAVDRPLQLDQTHRDPGLELSQTVGRHTTSPCGDSDSVSSGANAKLQCVSGERSPEHTHTASSYTHSQGDSEDELLDSGKSSRKCLRKSESIEEEDEGDNTHIQDQAVNMASIGLNTLDEEEEKARFFAHLEADAPTTIDYSRLNRELDSPSSTTTTNLRKAEEAVEHRDEERKATHTYTQSPAFTASPHYSEDFEEEGSGKEPAEKSTKTPNLAKVCLDDSLDDIGEADRRKVAAGSPDRGQWYVQSGASEMEALHEAYRQVHVVGDSEDHHSPPAVTRAVSPQHVTQSLQPNDTNESELPTAEELMRAIRPEEDHLRGFSLQPVSTADQEHSSHVLDKTLPEVTAPESQLKEAAGSPDTHTHDLTWSIRQEVDRLMQEHNKQSSQPGKDQKQQAFPGSTPSQPRPSPGSRGRVSAGPGRRAAVSSRPAALRGAKTHSTVPRAMLHPPQQDTFTKSPEKEDSTGERLSSELVSSVQSLVCVLQQQVDTSRLQGHTHTLQSSLTQQLPHNNLQREEVSQLREQLSQRDRELQVMKDEAEELRQNNYLLQSKLRSAEEASQKKLWAQASDSATEERLTHMDKELKEQEILIKGYQQENEKIYLQMKAQQAQSKSNEEAMFNENQRLLKELASIREPLNRSSRTVDNIFLTDQTQSMTQLLAQINTFQRKEAKLSSELHRLKQEKQALEVDLQLMKKDRDLAKAQAMSASGDTSVELRVLEERHREEVSALKKKLQWFAENQELLDRDADRQRAAAAHIHTLQQQVEQLKMDVSRRSSEQQRKAKEKPVNTKRTQDLERQVKELEQILRNRNPNSLPALLYAAASASSAASVPGSRVSAVLESRVQRLEAELEGHHEEAKRSLRAMEQQFTRIKLRYEQQISGLEQQLEAAGTEAGQTRVDTLEEELRRERETHLSLQDQISSLLLQLQHKEHTQTQPSPGRHQRQTEEAFGVRIERMSQELAAKTRTIQELSRTVERLQRERRTMLSVPNTHRADTKRQPAPAKTLSPTTAPETCGGGDTFPTAQYEKTYQPTVFTGSHISEVLQENESLKQRVEQLEQQTGQDRERLEAEAGQARQELDRVKQQCAEQLSSLKAQHHVVLEQLRASQALEHSSSKVATLANQLHTMEITVKHLKEQLKELQGTKDALAISRTREDALQTQLSRLLKELKEAKDCQSPEVKLLSALERKMLNMELRHQHRERELQQVIGSSWQTVQAEQLTETERWRSVAQDRSRELQAFRLELDSILDILRHLQTQGLIMSR